MRKGSKFQILFLSFDWRVNGLTQKHSYELYFVTLKGYKKFGTKLSCAFQVSSNKIGQFFSSGRKGSKFQILLLSFLWRVNWLNQKDSQEFYFLTLKSHAKFGPKLSFAFQISPKKLVSCSQHAKRVQISDFIAFFPQKSKLPEPKNLPKSFILWHWRAMQSLGQNWILLSK